MFVRDRLGVAPINQKVIFRRRASRGLRGLFFFFSDLLLLLPLLVAVPPCS